MKIPTYQVTCANKYFHALRDNFNTKERLKSLKINENDQNIGNGGFLWNIIGFMKFGSCLCFIVVWKIIDFSTHFVIVSIVYFIIIST